MHKTPVTDTEACGNKASVSNPCLQEPMEEQGYQDPSSPLITAQDPPVTEQSQSSV